MGYVFNPYSAAFTKLTFLPSIFGSVHYKIWGNQDKNLKLGQPTVEPVHIAQAWLYSGGKGL